MKKIVVIILLFLIVFTSIKIYIERNNGYLIGKIIDITEYNGIIIEYITGLKSTYKSGSIFSFSANNAKEFEKRNVSKSSIIK